MRSPEAAADYHALGAAFGFGGDLREARPLGAGHIHDTFLLRFTSGPSSGSAVLQRINESVVGDAAPLMENIARVTAHQRAKLAGTADAGRRALTVLPAVDGRSWHRDAGGAAWRAYAWISGTRPLGAPVPLAQARGAARAFAEFQNQLADLPPPRLHETIPHFHDTPRRFAAFVEAARADSQGRADGAAREIELAAFAEPLAGALVEPWRSGELVERVTHNDTKLDNVLFDEATGEALCVIDLDTVMPGLPLWDFGDMVRSAMLPIEDEPNLGAIVASEEIFGALASGYIEGLGDGLLAAERERLVLAGQVIVYECGLRFLTDHLKGDVYFKVGYAEQNLARARAHFALLRSLREREEILSQAIA